MSLIPENGHPDDFLRPSEGGVAPSLAASRVDASRRTRTWQSRLLGICSAIFTFEIGLFLVVFPWMDDVWNINYLQKLLPLLRGVWGDPYFRGALTGLGLVNIYISCLAMIRLFRRA